MFTKVVLTVIALNLTIITVKDLSFVPTRQRGLIRFRLGTKWTVWPRTIEWGWNDYVKLKPNDEIDVNIVGVETSDELDVNIDGINTNDELDVNIDEVGGSYVSSGTIKVKMD